MLIKSVKIQPTHTSTHPLLAVGAGGIVGVADLEPVLDGGVLGPVQRLLHLARRAIQSG